MQKPKQVQDSHVRRNTRSYLRLEVLDASQGQHMGLWIRTNLMPDRLQPRDHIIQRDALLRTVLSARKQLGSQLRLLARA